MSDEQQLGPKYMCIETKLLKDLLVMLNEQKALPIPPEQSKEEQSRQAAIAAVASIVYGVVTTAQQNKNCAKICEDEVRQNVDTRCSNIDVCKYGGRVSSVFVSHTSLGRLFAGNITIENLIGVPNSAKVIGLFQTASQRLQGVVCIKLHDKIFEPMKLGDPIPVIVLKIDTPNNE
jgi:hypothetical protein